MKILIYSAKAWPTSLNLNELFMHPSHISCSKINLTGIMSQINLMSMTDICLNIPYQLFIYFLCGVEICFAQLISSRFNLQVRFHLYIRFPIKSSEIQDTICSFYIIYINSSRMPKRTFFLGVTLININSME